MIYLGDNWPRQYRGRIFMCNTHGRRINQNILLRQGNSYVGKRAPDLLFANEPWFRGVELKYGPDGGVYIADWTDLGECHDYDGVHRTSGRIFKVTHGTPSRPSIKLAEADISTLIQLQVHPNQWYVRHARRLLSEKALTGTDLSAARDLLLRAFTNRKSTQERLQTVWALHAIDGADESFLLNLLNEADEHLQTWGIRLLTDGVEPKTTVRERFARLAQTTQSGLVRLQLASTLQRLSPANRWPIAHALASHASDANDRIQPLLIWYGIESAVLSHPMEALALGKSGKIPLLRIHIARRLTSEIDRSPKLVDQLVSHIGQIQDVSAKISYLRGMVAALEGRRRVKAPQGWKRTSQRLLSSEDKELAQLSRQLAVVFGDGRALQDLIQLVKDQSASTHARIEAIRVVSEAKHADFPQVLHEVLRKRSAKNRGILAAAATALAIYDDPKTPGLLINAIRRLKPGPRAAAIATLASRPSYARQLLDAMESGKVQRDEVSAVVARQVRSHNDTDLTKRLEMAWGTIRDTPAAKKQQMARLRKSLTPNVIANADRSKGRQVFVQSCAACHKMFGQGGLIGPDLTGSNRDNLDYLLENMVDPNAVVAADFRMATVTLKDGRVILGSIKQQTDKTIVLQTPTVSVTLERADVASINVLNQSLMPEGLLDALSPQQTIDLFGYLMGNGQAPLK